MDGRLNRNQHAYWDARFAEPGYAYGANFGVQALTNLSPFPAQVGNQPLTLWLSASSLSFPLQAGIQVSFVYV